MKRKASLAFVLALSAALALTGVVAAKDHTAHGQSGTHASGHVSTVAPSLKVKGNAAHPGGVFRVLAVLHAAKDLRPPTMTAVVHFPTGDVSVVLTESGHGSAYHGDVPVPAGEPAGVVQIDATAVVNGATLTATGSGKIVVETAETSETTSESSATSTTTTETSTTCTVTATETVTTTVTTTSSATSTVSETSETAASSDASETETDESSEASETETSESSESSESDESGSCDHESADTHASGLTAQSVSEFFALVASLGN